jgi:radical SAM protein with 4Fe4S-binding SPASM domain
MAQALCPLAIHQLYIHSSGEVYPCGFLQGEHSLGNITRSSLAEIWEGKPAKDFRGAHLNKNNLLCQSRQPSYNCHLLHENIWDEKKENSTPRLKRLDIMIDSFCNLKCIMCTNRTEVNGGFLNEHFWKEMEFSILPDLEEIEVVGGEPLILKDTYRLFELGQKINPNLRWSITTNGHLEFESKVKHSFKKLNFRSIAVSIDSLNDENFKKIRVNGDLKKTQSFLKKLIVFKQEEKLDFHVVCNFLIQKDNWYELQDLLDYAQKLGIKLYPILLREPESFSIFTLSDEEVLEVLDLYTEIYKKYKNLYVFNLVMKISKKIKKEELLKRISIFDKMKKDI